MVPPISFFGRELHAYTLTALVGILAALFFTYFSAKKQGLDEFTMLFAMLFAAAGAFLGGHIIYALTNIRQLIIVFRHLDAFGSFGSFLKFIYPYFSGAVFYGGLLLGLLFAWLYLRRTKQPLGGYTDIGAIGLPLFHGFGRIGCFLSGCCFGIESKCGFVMCHSIMEEANGVSRFPVQLCEAVFNFALALTLYVLLKKKKLQGRLLNVYLYAYPTFRFLDEFLRGDAYRGIWLGLSTSQWISLLLIAGNTIYLLAARSKNKKAAAEE